MERVENAWGLEQEWPVVRDENGEVMGGPAQGGGNTADEGTEAKVEVEGTGEPPRRIRKPRTRRRKVPAEPTTEADADNQGLPGSVMATDAVEAGQRLQEEADAFEDDERVQFLKQQHQRQLAALEEDLASRDAAVEGRDASIKMLEDAVAKYKDELRIERNSLAMESKYTTENMDRFAKEQVAFQKYRDENEETIKAAPANAAALADAKKLIADLTSDLKDAAAAKEQLLAQQDVLAAEVAELQAANESLESEVDTIKDVMLTNADVTIHLDDKINKVHADFEEAFSDMAKDLTLDEKFAYVREQQQQAVLAAHLATESSLHDELDQTPEPAENLSFSKIVSVETPPVAASVAAKKPLMFSNISSVDTPPTGPAAAAKKPMSFSKISSVDSAPMAAKEQPLSFSGTTSIETAPVTAPVATTPVVVSPADKIVKVYTPVDRYIDRAVVPWWMWLLLLLGLLLCVGGFAGLWREQQIWVAANETAYQRLTALSQETWSEWIIMGLRDLMPRIGGAGHSLYT